MLLRESGKRANQALNLPVVTGAQGLLGLDHEAELMAVAEAVYEGDPTALSTMRQATVVALGSQGLVDAISVAAAFNGITKIANATGLPLDATTVTKTGELRKETGIDSYSENHKASLFDE